MKNIIINNIQKIFVIVIMISLSYTLNAQPPSDPPGGSSGTGNNSGNSLGGNAPVGGGLYILLGLGVIYGGRKLYQLTREKEFLKE